MTTDIFIVSVGKHFQYLKYCLRSISKLATGFNKAIVLFPEPDKDAFGALAREYKGSVPLQGVSFAEWPGLGMVHHMFQIMHSDLFSEADLILHTDSDCVFTEPVTPNDYIVDGKPVLMYATFDWLCKTVQGNLVMWKQVTQNAIGGDVPVETMRRHPAIHHRAVYGLARQAIERHTGLGMVEFMRGQRNEFPQSFCEFVTLGNVAWRGMKDAYYWIDQQKDGFPPQKIYQGWSHRDPIPSEIELYKKLGIYD